MLEKGFLRQRYSFYISRKRFWTAAIIGLLSGFGIYTFFCLFRLFFRIFELSEVNGPLIFDSATRYAQNLNFAMLSLVLGNSIFLGFLFRKPYYSTLPEYRRLGIINNQVFLGFNFFYVFAKTFILGGIFMSFTYDMQSLPSFTWLYLLIALVLFFESYVTLIRCFRRQAFKAMCVNLLVLTILTFPLGTTSVFNYKDIDKVLLANNPPIDLPATEFKSDRYFTFVATIKIYNNSGETSYRLDDKTLDLRELTLSLSEYEYYRFFKPSIRIYVPKDLPMGELQKLQNQLLQVAIRNVFYITKNPEPQFTSRFEIEGIDKGLWEPDQKVLEEQNESLGLPPPAPSNGWRLNMEFIRDKKIVTVKITDRYQVDDLEIPKESLTQYFKRNIDNRTLFAFLFEDSVLFEDYLHAYAAYLLALDELRKEDQLIHRIYEWGPWLDENNNFATREDYDKDQDRLRQKYPMGYLENFDLEQAE